MQCNTKSLLGIHSGSTGLKLLDPRHVQTTNSPWWSGLLSAALLRARPVPSGEPAPESDGAIGRGTVIGPNRTKLGRRKRSSRNAHMVTILSTRNSTLHQAKTAGLQNMNHTPTNLRIKVDLSPPRRVLKSYYRRGMALLRGECAGTSRGFRLSAARREGEFSLSLTHDFSSGKAD
jgi:hypothetical protein